MWDGQTADNTTYDKNLGNLCLGQVYLRYEKLHFTIFHFMPNIFIELTITGTRYHESDNKQIYK